MRQGDVLLFLNDHTWIDWFIGIVSPRYAHVGIVLDTERFIDARMWKVCIRNIKNEKSEFDIYRPQASDHQIRCGVLWALSHNQEQYSTLAAIVAGLLRLSGLRRAAYKMDNRWVCSEFVAGALKSMGLNIGFDSLADVVPDDIANMDCVVQVSGQ